jgi:hypothetical protein
MKSMSRIPGTPGKPIFGCRGRRKVSTAGGAVARKNTLPKFIDWAWRLEKTENIGELFPLLAIS